KFTNVTNGVTPRRFLLLSNPRLAKLISSRIGDGWVKDLEALQQLEPLAEDPAFRREWRKVKQANKADLADFVRELTGIVISPDSLFDIQVKRFHEYKRQHLNVLHILTLFARLRRGGDASRQMGPRTFLFGGKAAPGYFMAKLIIKLINSVAAVINQDK